MDANSRKRKLVKEEENKDVAAKELKGKKTGVKKIKDKNAPRKPRTGYVLFLAANRAQFEKDHPTFETKEINAGLGALWSSRSEKEKKPFLDKAKKEKDEYERTFAEYKKSAAYGDFIKKTRDMEKKSDKRPRNDNDIEEEDLPKEGDIPIFSDGFLAYNRDQELLLKRLRKQAASLEDEQKHLKDHVNRLETDIGRMHSDIDKNRQKKAEVEKQLHKWRGLIVKALKSHHITDKKEPITVSNVDAFLIKVRKMSETANRSSINSVRNALSGVNLS